VSNRQHLIPALERLNTAVVGCVGDLMLDRFVYGDAQRISPEAPIPVLSIQSLQSMLGGLGNVVRNLGALGAGIRLFSITGEDAAAAEIRDLLKAIPDCQSWLLSEASRKTPVKVRYIAHSQQLLRADHETTDGAGPEVFAQLIGHFQKHVAECSVVFLSDYAKGVLKGSHARELIRVARVAGKAVVVDPKGSDFERYQNATVIKPNLKELAEATGMSTANVDAQESAARVLLERAGAEFLLVTRGQAGMLLVPKVGPRAEFPALAHEVYDVSGAGDTVAAVLAAALGSGAGITEAVELANIAASIVVGKVGTAVAERSEIVEEIERESGVAVGGKILRLPAAVERVRGWQRMGQRVGFVHDSFNPLTTRHLEALEQAHSGCDRLVVALTQPDGEKRGRSFLLASLAFVDGVVICDSHSVAQVVDALGPDVQVPLPSAPAGAEEVALFEATQRR
jgi:D-beta-D-heptose 7-phosphate kinase/D-beta-D-heptose 1-phosphate adenosyltransferase